jgi:PiT family inorganic phosphate transporter
MGLIMLILIGTVPTAYALNRAVPAGYTAEFHALSVAASRALGPAQAGPAPAPAAAPAARERVTFYLAERRLAPDTLPSLRVLIGEIDRRVLEYGSLARVPAFAVANIRNDMYLASETIRRLGHDPAVRLPAPTQASLAAYKGALDTGTRFIPNWVKVAVAIALGLGTMVGWKKIVVTVGEKIGRHHMTYAQGAAAGLVATATIFGADRLGLPVSTTHILSSGVAGTMAANGSGLRMCTIRNLLIAWLLTLPVSMLLAGGLYLLFARLF